ncbi:hypothetical protein TSUD_20100 [Trifolium subterraneum]|uniref:Reverse transcriptase zinc-binding domain-containing protein n=1 Tax=Trifolium subterraneum TaxID=3900 RepID=A0A2Z6MNZ6_TRISU|nr:hypothetical protein TSUD_20100 [Trifolium subterraneum]
MAARYVVKRGRLRDGGRRGSSLWREITRIKDSGGGAQSLDIWQWQPDPDKCYSVCGAYRLLTSQDLVTLEVAAGLIWQTLIPLKVFIFAWRLLRDRLPTKSNLVTRALLIFFGLLYVLGLDLHR